jgi:hypothetical protein
VGGLVLLSFLLDYVLEPPVAVRVVHGLLSLAVLGWIIARHIVGPLRRSLDDEELALALEARVPVLQDRLIGALQWERLLADPDCGESRTFMEASVVEAAERIRGVDTSVLVDRRPARRAMLAGLGALGLLVVLAATWPAEASTWFRRSVLLAGEEWPRRTHLVVLDFEAGVTRTVTVGDDLPLRIRVEGEVPRDGVRIHYEIPAVGDRGPRSDVRAAAQSDEEPSLFLFSFQEITGSFTFFAEGGDDNDGLPVYEVRALIPPALEEVVALLSFPANTGLPPEERREADLEVPMGTRVDLTLRSTVPVVKASISHPADTAGRPLEISEDGRSFRASVVVTESSDWRVDLEGADGARSIPSRNTRRFTAIPDPRPEVRILHPFARMYATADGRIPVQVRAKDNYSLASVGLEVKPGRTRDTIAIPLATWGGAAPVGTGTPAGAVKESRNYHLLDLATLAKASGGALAMEDEVLIRATASDNGGSESSTDEVPVQITEPAELLRRLSQRQTRIREELNLLRTHVRNAREAALRAVEATSGGAALSAADRETLRGPVGTAGRAVRESTALLDSLGEVLGTYVWNRLLDNRVASERTVSLMDDWLRQDVPPEGAAVFRPELWRLLSRAHASGAIEDRQILGALLESLGLADRLAAEESRKLHASLDTLGDGEGDDGKKAADAVAAGDACLTLLKELELRLQDWESMHEILEKARSIRDLQRAIREKLEGAGETPRGR